MELVDLSNEKGLSNENLIVAISTSIELRPAAESLGAKKGLQVMTGDNVITGVTGDNVMNRVHLVLNRVHQQHR